MPPALVSSTLLSTSLMILSFMNAPTLCLGRRIVETKLQNTLLSYVAANRLRPHYTIMLRRRDEDRSVDTVVSSLSTDEEKRLEDLPFVVFRLPSAGTSGWGEESITS